MKPKKYTLGEISFIVIGLFAPATLSIFGVFGTLLTGILCAYAGYCFYHREDKKIKIIKKEKEK